MKRLGMRHFNVSSAYSLVIDTQDSLTLVFKKPLRSWRDKLRFSYDLVRWIMRLPTSNAPETPIASHMRDREAERIDGLLQRGKPSAPRDIN